MTLDKLKALLELSDIVPLRIWELPTQYLPNIRLGDKSDAREKSEFIAYQSARLASPWFLFKTQWGLIEIGDRERVTSIDWSDTPLRRIITTDKTTKSETMVHSWKDEDTIKYLKLLRKALTDGT